MILMPRAPSLNVSSTRAVPWLNNRLLGAQVEFLAHASLLFVRPGISFPIV